MTLPPGVVMPLLSRSTQFDPPALPQPASGSPLAPLPLVAPVARDESVGAMVLARANEAPASAALLVCEASGGVRRSSFAMLAARAGGYASMLERDGLGTGARVLVLVPPSRELTALALALLARGMTLVLVDGSLSRRRMYAALDAAAPDAVVGVPRVMRRWPLFAALRRARRFTARGAVPGTRSLGTRVAPLDALPVDGDAIAVLSFTSGSSGRTKMIARTHRVLCAQQRSLAAALPLDGGDVHLSAFPMAVLHDLCCGAATALPGSDRGDRVDATLAAIVSAHATIVSAAPALLAAVARRAVERGIDLRAVRAVIAGGGPVSRQTCDVVLRAFPEADCRVLYGASEAEPIAHVSMLDVRDTPGDGFLVGAPVRDVEVRLANEERGAGEVCVRGSGVVAAAGAWHPTGDVAARDDAGRLWLVGTAGDPIDARAFAIEADVLAIPGVRAAAFLAHRRAPEGALAIELAWGAHAGHVGAAARAVLDARTLPAVRIHFVDEMPMDARHGSKVLRGELRRRLERRRR